jgi:hypothetical protein
LSLIKKNLLYDKPKKYAKGDFAKEYVCPENSTIDVN